MKKLAKIFLAVLIVMALVGTLAVVVSANTSATADTWTPGENVYFARWASLSSYENGDEPVEVYTSADLTTAEFKSWSGANYVRLYQDVVLEAAGDICDDDIYVTFELDGHKFTFNQYAFIRNGNINLTFKNGYVEAPNNYIRIWSDTTLTFDNADVSGGSDFYFNLSGGTINVINGSTLTIPNATPFRTTTENANVKINVESSDVVLPGAIPSNPSQIGDNTKGGIFHIYGNVDKAPNYEFRVDANSSLTAPSSTGAMLLTISMVEGKTVDGTNINFIFEKGAKVKGVNTALNYAYLAGGVAEWAPAENAKVAANVFVAEADGFVPVTYKLVTLGDGTVVLADESYVPPVEPEQPEVDPWQPTEDVYFARWSSFNSYKSGEEPVEIYTASLLSMSETQSWYGTNYVRLYKDVDYAGGGWWFQKNVNVTFELDGHTITNMAYGFIGRDQDVTLTYKNGNVVQPDSYIRMWNNTVITFDNVDFTGTGTTHFKANGQLNIINGSTVTMDSRAPFLITAGEGNGARVIVENSEIILTHTRFIQAPDNLWCAFGNEDQGGIFTLYNNTAAAIDAEFRLDANSSITTSVNNAILFGIYADSAFDTNSNIRFVIEKGAQIKGITNVNYAYNSTVDGYGWGSADAAIQANVFVTEPDGTQPSEYELQTLPNGTKVFTDVGADLPELPEEPEDQPTYWVPTDKNVYFAYWSNEQAYKNGEQPDAVYTDGVLTKDISNSWRADGGSFASHYVRFYNNVVFDGDHDSDLVMGNQTVYIDLNGFTFSSDFSLRPGHNTTASNLIFKNGTVNLNHQFRVERESSLTFENVILNCTRIGYASGGNVTIKNSTVTLSAANPFYFGTSGPSGARILIENSDIILTSGSLNADPANVGGGTGAIFNVYANSTDSWGYEANLSFAFRIDGDSTIKAINSNNAILFAIDYENIMPAGRITDIQFVIEKGAIFQGINTNVNYAYKANDGTTEWAPATGALVPATIFVAEPNGTTPAEYKLLPVGDAVAFVNPDATVYEPQAGDFFGIWESETSYYIGDAPIKVYTTATLTSEITQAAGTAYIRLFNDVTWAGNDIYVVADGAALVLDLNGNRLTLDNRFITGKESVAAALEICNGELYAADYALYAKEGNVLKLYNVYLNAKEAVYFSNAESVVFEKCELHLTGNTPISISYSDRNAAISTIKFVDTDIFVEGNISSSPNGSGTYTGNAIITAYHSWAVGFNWQVVFDADSTLVYTGTGKAPNWLALVNDTASDYTGYPQIIFEEGFSVSANLMPSFKFIIDWAGEDYYFETMTDSGIFSLRNANGEVIDNYRAKLNADGTCSLVAGEKPILAQGDFTANLTLYTNFNLNFFANAEVIKGLYANGVQIESVIKAGKTAYVLEVPVDEAADNIALTVVILVDGETYLYNLNYSIVTYANQIMEGEYSEASKLLVSAAINYVQQAYWYTEKGYVDFIYADNFMPVENNADAIETIGNAISGVQLDLATGYKLRFNLNSAYTGTLTVGDATYEVVQGKVGELAYVEANLRAYELAGDVVITDATGNYTYSLANYAKSDVVVNDYNLSELANALYTFASYAAAYKASNPNLD